MSAPIQMECRLTGQNTQQELVLQRAAVLDSPVAVQLGREIVVVSYTALALAIAALEIPEPDSTIPNSPIPNP